MKAVVLERFGGPEELVLRDIPIPDIAAHKELRKHCLGKLCLQIKN
jgi:NADPH:quinone reductase-like Zn-dependent oxidoreductase